MDVEPYVPPRYLDADGNPTTVNPFSRPEHVGAVHGSLGAPSLDDGTRWCPVCGVPWRREWYNDTMGTISHGWLPSHQREENIRWHLIHNIELYRPATPSSHASMHSVSSGLTIVHNEHELHDALVHENSPRNVHLGTVTPRNRQGPLLAYLAAWGSDEFIAPPRSVTRNAPHASTTPRPSWSALVGDALVGAVEQRVRRLRLRFPGLSDAEIRQRIRS